MKIGIEDLKFDARGLLPAVVQDARTREVLTVAYVNAESLARTLSTGETWFWSRSRQELWHKGATSGNTQRVVGVVADCDADAVAILVEPAGPACHTGARTCFHNEFAGSADSGATFERRGVQGGEEGSAANQTEGDGASRLGATLARLYAVIESRRREMPAGSYTTYLFEKGLDKILKKVGEESAETIIAAKNGERVPLVSEVSDLLYHLVVLLVERGVPLDEISAELESRASAKVRDR
ncbi:MAG: bifunctional phosphoribosyl-AMP cyclohydrolase/phosphoribosyl-ATP diphosphatase HisIE [Acidobacteriota bacterium]|nr:bifunctional phosphoribosyl-AMP cyclohydrolase/phosphoribosyl-ATP diphosphatase HisIE [Acidobacteriota bacterium]